VAVSRQTAIHEGQEARDEAYRMVVELLVGFRRIVHRALLRVCGNEWFEQGCPLEVRRRLLERQEIERAVDRGASQVDDLFGHATFADLADIIGHPSSLAEVLRPLAASPERLCADLRTLEELRIKVADARPISEADHTLLVELRLRLRAKLAGARRRAHPEEDLDEAPLGVERGADSPEITQEIVPEITQEIVPEVTQEILPETTGGITVPDEQPAAGAPAPAPPARPRLAVVEGPPSASSAVGMTAGGGSFVLGGAPTPVGLVTVDRDDLAVLRELRLEIIAIAEAAYANSDRITMKVWARLWDSGWFSRKMERYGLGEVATFYAVVEQYLERRGKGYDRQTMRNFLADRELAKILLRLRELFLRLRV
jgi:hypothetical protein